MVTECLSGIRSVQFACLKSTIANFPKSAQVNYKENCLQELQSGLQQLFIDGAVCTTMEISALVYDSPIQENIFLLEKVHFFKHIKPEP